MTGEGWFRRLLLRRDAAGGWSAERDKSDMQPGELPLPDRLGVLPALAGVLDCDLGGSPLTNSMPILPHGLQRRTPPPVDLITAWASVPDLDVAPFAQRYVPVWPGRVRYENADGTFASELAVDGDGLVIDYPGIARRLGASRKHCS